jgi:hypothetical protein
MNVITYSPAAMKQFLVELGDPTPLKSSYSATDFALKNSPRRTNITMPQTLRIIQVVAVFKPKYGNL